MENPTLTPNVRAQIMGVVRALTGSENIVAIPRAFILWTGDLTRALLLNQIAFWQKDDDQFVPVPYATWQELYGLSEYQVRAAAKHLKEMAIGFETRVMKHDGTPVVHYHLDPDIFAAALLQRTQNGNRSNFSFDPEKTSGSDPEETSGTHATPVPEETEVSSFDLREDQEQEENPETRARARAEASPDKPPGRARAKKPRPDGESYPRRPHIDALAECVFGIKPPNPAGKEVWVQCGKILAELQAPHPAIRPEDIYTAFAWFRRAYPSLSPPRRPDKVVAMVNEWLAAAEQAERRRQRALRPPADPYATEEEFTPPPEPDWDRLSKLYPDLRRPDGS